MPGPFAGLRVVELSTIFVGPYTAQFLGDMGADVIKVEAPGGDTTRMTGPSVHADMSSNFLHVNRNKRSISLDLKTEAGAEALRGLLRQADVFLHNMRPEPLERLGFDYARVREVKPDIVYCNIWGFGRDGRYAGRAAYDDVVQGACGMVALEAFGGGPVRYIPSLIVDKTTALFAAYAISAALFHRKATGEGQEIEVPMFESMVSFTMLEHLWGATFDPPRGRVGSARHATPLRWPHATKDGHICAMPSTVKHWRALIELTGRYDLKDHPVVGDRQWRKDNLPEMMRIVGEIIATRTTAEWMDVLPDAGIPCMRISSLDDVVADPHLAEVGFWHAVDHPTEGRLRLMNPPYTLSKTPAEIRRPPPRYAEHTRAILAELGYSDDAIERMIEAGAAVDGPGGG